MIRSSADRRRRAPYAGRVTAERRPAGWLAAQATAARALTWARGPHPGVQLITTVLQVIARLAPSHDPVPGVEEHLDLPYGSAPTERLDLYRPAGGQQSLPVVVWVHGGAWVGGDKSDIGFYLRLLAVEGYACVAINYGLAPESNYPEPVRQTGLALAWLAEHATRYGLAPDRVVLAGSSAGAQIAAQYAAVVSDQAYAADVGIEPAIDAGQLVGTVLHCGPYDRRQRWGTGGWRGWYSRTVGGVLGRKISVRHRCSRPRSSHVTAGYRFADHRGEEDSLSPQTHAFAGAAGRVGVPHEALGYREELITSTSSTCTGGKAEALAATLALPARAHRCDRASHGCRVPPS